MHFSAHSVDRNSVYMLFIIASDYLRCYGCASKGNQGRLLTGVLFYASVCSDSLLTWLDCQYQCK